MSRLSDDIRTICWAFDSKDERRSDVRAMADRVLILESERDDWMKLANSDADAGTELDWYQRRESLVQELVDAVRCASGPLDERTAAAWCALTSDELKVKP